jgi:hemin uptake protein HemP
VYLLYRLRPRSAAAERRNPMGGECEILSVGRLTNGEVAVLISHHCQCHGLRTELLARLLIVGADEKLGFSVRHALEDQVVKAELQL